MYGVARLGYKYEMGEEIGVGMIIVICGEGYNILNGEASFPI